LASAHYRSTLDYSPSAIAESASAVSRIQNFLKRLPSVGEVGDDAFRAADLPSAFVAAMDADFNVPAALAVLHDAVRQGNTKLDSNQDAAPEARAVAAMLHALNLNLATQAEVDEDLAARVEELIARRAEARANRDFALADQIRQEIAALGVTIEDTPTKTTWSLNG
jgi:cysteinyl-tRNA synthetase